VEVVGLLPVTRLAQQLAEMVVRLAVEAERVAKAVQLQEAGQVVMLEVVVALHRVVVVVLPQVQVAQVWLFFIGQKDSDHEIRMD
jgi:hypothetical protein